MTIPVYLEVGSKRTFASALDWPGWARSGKGEEAALEALLNYGLRYAGVVRPLRLGFQAPEGLSAFDVVQRLDGDATTDFGAPGGIPPTDVRPMDEAELRRMQSVLRGCWRTFDELVEASEGQTLKPGPRGGGRDLKKIIEHVLGAEQAYLSRLGVKLKLPEGAPLPAQLDQCRQAVQDGLRSAVQGDLPAHGPRGGLHWPARYFVRRAAWHVLDHAWEIEDRLL